MKPGALLFAEKGRFLGGRSFNSDIKHAFSSGVLTPEACGLNFFADSLALKKAVHCNPLANVYTNGHLKSFPQSANVMMVFFCQQE
jgi:hypothetical protein